MRLYYRPQTGRPLRVAWALEEIGADYDAVAVRADQVGAPPHRGRHPLGRVPVLEFDDGQTLFESAAIVLSLADRYPDSGLSGPMGSALREQVYVWSIMAMTELERPILGAWERSGPVDDAYRARQREALSGGLEAVGEQLAGSAFLLGDTLTAADIVLGGVLAVAQHTRALGGAPEPVVAYLARLQDRETYTRALRRTESLLADPG